MTSIPRAHFFASDSSLTPVMKNTTPPMRARKLYVPTRPVYQWPAAGVNQPSVMPIAAMPPSSMSVVRPYVTTAKTEALGSIPGRGLGGRWPDDVAAAGISMCAPSDSVGM